MDVMYYLMDLVAKIPELAVLIVCPAILLVCGVLFAIFDLKRAYLPVAVGLGGLGFFFAASRDIASSFAYIGLYVVWASLLTLLFLIPPRKKAQRVQDELFDTFYKPLDIGEEEPKAECGETIDKEECDLKLSHTMELLDKLKKSDLSASDRLEADALTGTVEGFMNKELTPQEMRSLNDCLATILKLTAKYKL